MSNSSRSLNILVAEDNMVNQMLISGILAQFNHQVIIAPDGEEAVERAAAGQFDLILMDVHMPKLDGISAAQKIRDFAEPAANIPIIALTADSEPDKQEKFSSCGINIVVAKPIDVSALCTAINTALNEEIHSIE